MTLSQSGIRIDTIRELTSLVTFVKLHHLEATKPANFSSLTLSFFPFSVSNRSYSSQACQTFSPPSPFCCTHTFSTKSKIFVCGFSNSKKVTSVAKFFTNQFLSSAAIIESIPYSLTARLGSISSLGVNRSFASRSRIAAVTICRNSVGEAVASSSVTELPSDLLALPFFERSSRACSRRPKRASVCQVNSAARPLRYSCSSFTGSSPVRRCDVASASDDHFGSGVCGTKEASSSLRNSSCPVP